MMTELTVWTFYTVRDVKWPVKEGKKYQSRTQYLLPLLILPHAFFKLDHRMRRQAPRRNVFVTLFGNEVLI